MWIVFVIAALVFGLAILGLASGRLLGGRCLRGSCGGLAMLDEQGRSICGLCGAARGDGDPHEDSATAAGMAHSGETAFEQRTGRDTAGDCASAVAKR